MTRESNLVRSHGPYLGDFIKIHDAVTSLVIETVLSVCHVRVGLQDCTVTEDTAALLSGSSQPRV